MPYCPDRGTEVGAADTFCRECGAELATPAVTVPASGETPAQIDSMVDLEWACMDCGERHPRNSPPCDTCGGMRFEAIQNETDRVTPDQSESASDTTRHTHFYIGAVLAVIGVLLFPYFFFLIAIPESIHGFFGSSIQNYLSEDAQNNPFVSGSFLILRWFGNFLILVFVLAFLAVLILSAI